MFLEVTFNDGTTLDVGLTNSHTVQVIGPGNTIENAFAVSGVKSVQLVEGDVPAAPSVSQPVEQDADPVHAAADAAVEDAAADPSVAAPDAQPDGSTSSPDVSDTPPSGPQDSTADTTDDPAHADAVAQAQDGIAAAADAKPKDRAELVQLVQADVESALAQWPDSQPLLDAKAQLDTLAAEA